jgi:hypothetical protein
LEYEPIDSGKNGLVWMRIMLFNFRKILWLSLNLWLEEYIMIQIGMDQSPIVSVQQIMLYPFNHVTSLWWALGQVQWVASSQPRTICV